jgi:capsular polysaccharide transport system permease protein
MTGDQSGKVQDLVGLVSAPMSDPGPPQQGREQRLAEGQSRGDRTVAQGARAAGAVDGDRVSPRGPRDQNRIPQTAGGNNNNLAAVRRIEQRLTVISPKRIAAAGAAYSFPDAVSKKPAYGAYIGFVLCVVLPVLIASIYYGFYASNQYVAEFRFTVKDAAPTSTSMSSSGITALMGISSPNSGDNYLVADFLTSREAVADLQKTINVTRLYSKPNVDWWSRFDASQPIEKFMPYWAKMVSANYDQVTGIAQATVRAFSPQDALLIANSLVKLSEDLVNRIANRSATDAVRFAANEVTRAEARLKNIRAKLTEFRNRTGVIDPTTSVTASNSSLIQTLRASLAQMETQLSTLQRQNLSPNAPIVVTLKNQIKSTRDQIQSTEATVGNDGDKVALSAIVGEYEQLNLETQFAQNMVTSTMQALDQARANAASQHLYITPYVRPSLPESSTYPRRIFSVAYVGMLGFIFWIIGLLIMRSVTERFS